VERNWNPAQPPLRGRLVVVGGQCSNVGKTTLIASVIAAFPDLDWTAVKITPHAHSGCPVNGRNCGCGPHEHTFAIREETSQAATTDSARFLAAGAKRSLWIETKSERLTVALPTLTAQLQSDSTVIIESNAILEFWRPAIALMVLDPAIPDFKPSAAKAFALAGAFVLRSPIPVSGGAHPLFAELPPRPKFLHRFGEPLPAVCKNLLCRVLAAASVPPRGSKRG